MSFIPKFETKTSQWVRDSENVAKTQWALEIEKQKQNNIKWAKEQESDCVFVEDNTLDAANANKQMGNPLTPEQFETKLTSLFPNFYFMFNPHNPKMKALYILNGEDKKYICAYHNELMPEHSIIKVKKELVWDPNQTAKKLERPQSGTYEWQNGKMVFDENAPRPGWKVIKKPFGELKRGWRTVLMQLVLKGILTPHQVESTFGLPTSQIGQRSWAYNTGKRTDKDLAMPW